MDGRGSAVEGDGLVVVGCLAVRLLANGCTGDLDDGWTGLVPIKDSISSCFSLLALNCSSALYL